MPLPSNLALPPDPGRRVYPRHLPDAWWDLPESRVGPLLRDMVWPSGMPAPQSGPMLERLVHHHPRWVPLAMARGLRPGRWRRVTGPSGQPLPRPGASTSALMFLLEHGDAAMLDQALHHRLALDAAELQRWPSLALAVVTLSREARPDSTLGQRTPAERFERERAMLTVLGEHEQPMLGGAHAGEGLIMAVQQRSGPAVLEALREHGVDPGAWPREGPPRGARVALHRLIGQGEVGELDRFLVWGLPLAQGPGDDTAALEVVGQVPPRFTAMTNDSPEPEETPAGWALRQVALLDTLARHGWTPGPRFHTWAVLTAVRASTDPSLLPHLIARGADPFATTPEGNTALHGIGRLLTGMGNLLALLDLGLDPLARNAQGRSALDELRDGSQGLRGAHLEQHAAAIAAMERAVLRQPVQPVRNPDDPTGAVLPERTPRARL